MNKELNDYEWLKIQKYKPKLKDILYLLKLLITFKFSRLKNCLKYIFYYYKNDK